MSERAPTSQPAALSLPGDPTPGTPAPSEQIDDRCDACGTPLLEGQEWCLQCGAARTLIHPPPDWRTGLLIVIIIVALALAGFGYALTRLTASGRAAPAVVTQVRTVRVPASPRRSHSRGSLAGTTAGGARTAP